MPIFPDTGPDARQRMSRLENVDSLGEPVLRSKKQSGIQKRQSSTRVRSGPSQSKPAVPLINSGSPGLREDVTHLSKPALPAVVPKIVMLVGWLTLAMAGLVGFLTLPAWMLVDSSTGRAFTLSGSVYEVLAFALLFSAVGLLHLADRLEKTRVSRMSADERAAYEAERARRDRERLERAVKELRRR